jgi:hypothetical protein
MGEVVNLRRVRKDRQRKSAEDKADANRVAFGRTKSERELTSARKDLAARQLDGHRRDDPPTDDA